MDGKYFVAIAIGVILLVLASQMQKKEVKPDYVDIIFDIPNCSAALLV